MGFPTELIYKSHLRRYRIKIRTGDASTQFGFLISIIYVFSFLLKIFNDSIGWSKWRIFELILGIPMTIAPLRPLFSKVIYILLYSISTIFTGDLYDSFLGSQILYELIVFDNLQETNEFSHSILVSTNLNGLIHEFWSPGKTKQFISKIRNYHNFFFSILEYILGLITFTIELKNQIIQILLFHLKLYCTNFCFVIVLKKDFLGTLNLIYFILGSTRAGFEINRIKKHYRFVINLHPSQVLALMMQVRLWLFQL